MVRMGRQQACFLLLLVLFFFSVPMAMGHKGEGGGREIFLLQRSKKVVMTEAGEVRVVRGYKAKGIESPMHIGFITMEPKSLFLPQYMDANLIIFIHKGSTKIGWISEDGLNERELKMGDVFKITAGSAFYLLNIHNQQKLHIICSIDTSESLGHNVAQSFFIGGGMNPTSVLAGFDNRTLITAFNVSTSELDEIMSRQKAGPIIYVTNPEADTEKYWTSFMHLKHQENQPHDQKVKGQEQYKWTWRKLLKSLFIEEVKNEKRNEEVKNEKRNVRSLDSYNIYEREPDFQNNYGSSITIDENDFKPLGHSSNIGVYLVNLTAGSMMAPHLNPTATEYGVVLKGSGSIQVVYPDGTNAMNAKVKEGDVFWVPRYFPFCQIASQSGSMEFFGFTSSARKNRPQFLAGASSILKSMNGPEIATSFDVSEKRFDELINAQHESIILPSMVRSTSNTREKQLNKKKMMMMAMKKKKKNKKMERVEPLIKSFASDMIDHGF